MIKWLKAFISEKGIRLSITIPINITGYVKKAKKENRALVCEQSNKAFYKKDGKGDKNNGR